MTSAELLELFNDLASRAATDSITPEKKYTWLTRAEREVISEVATVRPSILYQKVATALLPTLDTADSNVFTFGAGVEPFGRVQIYRRPTDVPDRPLVEGWDYISEGNQIRAPRGRVLAGPLYWRGIVMPAAISATEAPHLIPGASSELTALRAAANFLEGGNVRNGVLADRLRSRYGVRFRYWCLIWKQQFNGGGALLTSVSLRDQLTT